MRLAYMMLTESGETIARRAKALAGVSDDILFVTLDRFPLRPAESAGPVSASTFHGFEPYPAPLSEKHVAYALRWRDGRATPVDGAEAVRELRHAETFITGTNGLEQDAAVGAAFASVNPHAVRLSSLGTPFREDERRLMNYWFALVVVDGLWARNITSSVAAEARNGAMLFNDLETQFCFWSLRHTSGVIPPPPCGTPMIGEWTHFVNEMLQLGKFAPESEGAATAVLTDEGRRWMEKLPPELENGDFVARYERWAEKGASVSAGEINAYVSAASEKLRRARKTARFPVSVRDVSGSSSRRNG